MTRYNLSFAGAGRVAGALCTEMHHRGMKISRIVSESDSNGKPLAYRCNASWSAELTFDDTTDIIIVAVPDHKLKDILFNIKCPENIVVAHTAGSFGLEVFPLCIKNKGIFYPLQTFSKDRAINFDGLPILIEASDDYTGDMLKKLALSIGGEVHFVDTERRKMIHLAAVFVCNFTNHMLNAGEEIALKAGLNINILKPLINETIFKALENGPEVSQTGPAVRNDLITIKKHLKLLSFSPELQDVYRKVTYSIMKHHKTG